MKRGFKNWCEEESLRIRKLLHIPAYNPLPYEQLAKHLGVLIVDAAELPLPDNIHKQLFVKDKTSWSATSIPIQNTNIILYNPTTSIARRVSSIMHEMAHLLCGHSESQFVQFKGTNFYIRTYDADKEEEADWLAGCLLLPRPALLFALKQKIHDSEIRTLHQVSAELLRFRMNKTGVKNQIGNFQRSTN